MIKALRRFVMWLGYVPTWFTELEFERSVGRRPCVGCIESNAGEAFVILCDHDIDAWFDAVLS